MSKPQGSGDRNAPKAGRNFLDSQLAKLWVQIALRNVSALGVGVMAGGIVNSVSGPDGVDWLAISQLKATYASLMLVCLVAYVEYRASGRGREARESDRIEDMLDRLAKVLEEQLAKQLKDGSITDMKSLREKLRSR